MSEEEEDSLPDDEDDRLLFNLEEEDEGLSLLSSTSWNSLEQVDSIGSSKSVRRRDDVDPEVASSNNL